MSSLDALLRDCLRGHRPSTSEAMQLLLSAPLAALQPVAEQLALDGHGPVISYSPKAFFPLTRLCRDVCHYCTFATAPRHLESPYMTLEAVSTLAERAQAAGCIEALFTLGDKPEQRYRVAAHALRAMGMRSTVEYTIEVARFVAQRYELLPHVNAGVLSAEELAALRPHVASFGLMLESSSRRLGQPGMPHYGSPDKAPERRLATLRAAGELSIPTTSGLLIGIGETRRERIESLLVLRKLHERYGHLQDLIVQNFRAKPGTRMAEAPEPSLEDQLWTIAVTRILFGPTLSLQTPPNLRADALVALARSGINDWGGVSPLTLDHVNPEAPWPEREALTKATRCTGRDLLARLPLTPRFAQQSERWLDAAMATRVRRLSDAQGYARLETWSAGGSVPFPAVSLQLKRRGRSGNGGSVERALASLSTGVAPDVGLVTRLLEARAGDAEAVIGAADELRRATLGDRVSFVVNRNINYTNICNRSCSFCAFAKRSRSDGPGDAPYLLSLDEIGQRAAEAAARGATEVCLQGGIHPAFDGNTYLDIVRAVKSAAPQLHVHAFSPLEVSHGAATLGLRTSDYLQRLQAAGLATLPGTAAEVLDDDLRRTLCPDKLSTKQWLETVETAHRLGLRTTATLMFGHIDRAEHWAAHLLALRALQERTGGFTEFVPLPFVHREAPLWRRGLSRNGPTSREVLLVHAVARLVLHPLITHIQASWVKLGLDGLAACLQSGVDDMGGVLMNESITRAAGGQHGQLLAAEDLQQLAAGLGRSAWQRNTLYEPLTTAANQFAPVGCTGHREPQRLRFQEVS